MFKKDEEMIDNDELFQQLPAFTQIMAITWSACAHIGALNGTYSTPRVPFDGAKKGAHRALRSSLELRQWLPESGMEGCMLANLVGNQFQAYSLMSIAYVCPTELAAAKQVLLGEGGSLVVQWFASYQLEWHATSVAINQDPWHGESGICPLPYTYTLTIGLTCRLVFAIHIAVELRRFQTVDSHL